MYTFENLKKSYWIESQGMKFRFPIVYIFLRVFKKNTKISSPKKYTFNFPLDPSIFFILMNNKNKCQSCDSFVLKKNGKTL